MFLGYSKIIIFCSILIAFISGCRKDPTYYLDDGIPITISQGITVSKGYEIHDDIFNYDAYTDFLKYLSASDHFKIVALRDFDKTFSTDKVVLTIKHDVDANINAAIRFAYLEHKYGIKASYFILHTADYYGIVLSRHFIRNENIIYYLKKIQNDFGQEVGVHNDLVTLQIIYKIEPKKFLHDLLGWWRANGINVTGSTAHGSVFCRNYGYLNEYFWADITDTWDGFPNRDSVNVNGIEIKIEKDSLKSYNLDYQGDTFKDDYYFSDSDSKNDKRWNPWMINMDTIQPGKKILMLIHPQHWD